MKKHYLQFLSIIMTTAALASAAYAQSSFWAEAARGGSAEVTMARLALTKAAAPSVKAFAQKLIDEHTVMNQQLKALAAAKKVALPTDMANRDELSMKTLNGLTGKEFDAEFVKQMIKSHELAVMLFRRASVSETDGELKAFAAKNLPKLQEHLKAARAMGPVLPATTNKKMKKPAGGA